MTSTDLLESENLMPYDKPINVYKEQHLPVWVSSSAKSLILSLQRSAGNRRLRWHSLTLLPGDISTQTLPYQKAGVPTY